MYSLLISERSEFRSIWRCIRIREIPENPQTRTAYAETARMACLAFCPIIVIEHYFFDIVVRAFIQSSRYPCNKHGVRLQINVFMYKTNNSHSREIT